MKFQLISAILASAITTSVVAQTAPATPAAKPANQTASAAMANIDKATLAYAFGYEFGRTLSDQAPGLDVTAINRALQDGYAKKQPAIAPEKLKSTVETFQKQREAAAKVEFDKISRENKAKSDAALAQNKNKPGVITLPSGIQYKILEAGSGAKPNPNSTVDFNFSGALASNGQVFASTFANVKPVTGKLSQVASLPGMLEVMQMMPAGARWQVLLPADKAWGNGPESLRGGPGPNQAILLDIKLIAVK